MTPVTYHGHPAWGPQGLARVFAVAFAFAVVPLAGCQPSRPAGSSASNQRQAAADEFDAGANRPPTARTLMALSHLLACQNRDADCAQTLHRLLVQYPDCQEAYVELAQCLMRQQDHADATTVLDAALARWPNNPALLNDLGMCHLLARNYDNAADAFARAHAAAPAERLYQANLAMAVGMGGRYDQSLVLYQDVLPAAEAHYNLALLCQARGDTTRADQEFATAKSMGFGPPKPALPQP